MLYKLTRLLFLLILFSCVSKNLEKDTTLIQQKSFFLNKGFTLVYNDDLYLI